MVDVDNTSGELTLTIYYSNDSFVSHNESVTMSYNDTISADTYRYIYEWDGEPANTYYDYYYQVFDGEHTVKENNSGLYYDILWGELGVDQDNPFNPFDHITEFIQQNITGAMTTFMFIVIIVALFKSRRIILR